MRRTARNTRIVGRAIRTERAERGRVSRLAPWRRPGDTGGEGDTGGRNDAGDADDAGDAGDAGISTVEVVILAPVMILFILVLVAFGQLVDARGAVDSAARNAARAGSLQHDAGQAIAEARRTAVADLADVCAGDPSVRKTSIGFEPGGLFSVEVTCQVRGLAMLGLDIGTHLSGTSSSPIDPYRRAG